MTQRTFKMDNEQDVKDLFDILPDKVIRLVIYDNDEDNIHAYGEGVFLFCFINRFPKLDMCGLTEVTRPVDESQYIGKYGLFWDDDGYSAPNFGKLLYITKDKNYPYQSEDTGNYQSFRTLTNEEKANLA
ncbi:hypothetical protein NO1_0575 [Candidatus Termititenax aidoneus]|uniref:Uncharacterized protein n=1 Tax=Termititenax aidoneus TaxID=2218524 RepID=A0A388TBN1_TERA1|nr:hypothetical protein NO1_0575 [Candidatus Termititenax aidoneus]